MPMELLKQIEAAETKAAESLAYAQREARDILKAVDDACRTDKRNAVLEHRAMTQRVLEDTRVTAQRQIDGLNKAQALERETLTETARQRLPEAARLIFERVVKDGTR